MLPDYQGIGIGRKFLNVVAKKYRDMGFDFSIVTSAKNLINALRKDPLWTCIRYGKTQKSATGLQNMKKTIRNNVKTGSFFFR